MSNNKDMGRKGLNRRGFIKAAAAGIGVAAAGTAAPWIWTPRASWAAISEHHASAKHMLILYADGGMRSPAIFNANLSLQWNPHVDGEGRPTQPGARGTEWDVGAVLDNAPIALPSWGQGEVLRPLPAVSDKVTVLGTVDHQPFEETSDANHQTARQRMTTGRFDGRMGFLAQISKFHPMYEGQKRFEAFPPVVIGGGARLYGEATGQDGLFRALFFNGPQDFQRRGIRSFQIPQADWSQQLGQKLDQRFSQRLALDNAARVSLYLDSKANKGRFRDILGLPMLNLLEDGAVDRELGTNQMMREAFGAGPWGAQVALAVRMLQLGSPAVAVGVGGYDTHSNEMVDFPPLAQDLGRQLAALIHVLPRLPHPEGGTFWDHTIVTVLSEFSRDNTERLTGYNSAQGSDHQGLNGSRHQAIPFLGGAIPGGKMFGRTDPTTMAALNREEVFHSQGILSTLADAVGVDPGRFFDEAPVTTMYKG